MGADAQQSSELAKGQTILANQAADTAAQNAYQQKLAQVKTNVSRLKWGSAAAGLGLLHGEIGKILDCFNGGARNWSEKRTVIS